MLCLGPGSSCDVCLEAFSNDLKVPCSIACGHVFCAECLNRITRQACPLCRVHFDPRAAIKLHVDLDGIRGTAPNGDNSSDALSAGQEARNLQERIAAVANVGTTEPGLRQLISDCKAFLSSQPRNLFQDLRVSLRMIAYLCEVKSKLRSQNQEVDSLKERVSGMQLTIEDLNRCLGEAKARRKEEKANALERELELTRAFSEMQTKCLEAKEQLQEQRAENESLQTELKCLRSGSGSFYQEPSFNHHHKANNRTSSLERRSSRSELRGLSPPQQDFMISPLPEFTSNALAADTFVHLPDVEERSEEGATEYATGCGAAGCPHSCSCQPVSLFLTAEDASSQSEPGSSPMAPQTTPSLLSLTAPRGDDSGSGQRSNRSHSFSGHSQSASNAPTRPASPTSRGSSEEQMMTPNPTERNHILRYHLQEILTDTPPGVSSSLPNFGGRHFSPQGESSTPPGTNDSPPPRRSAPSRSTTASLTSLSPQPITIPMALPVVSLTPASSITSQLPNRPALSRASSHAVALENAQREKRREDKERQRSEMEKRKDREGLATDPNYSPNSAGSVTSSAPHSGVNGLRSSNASPAGDVERPSRSSPPLATRFDSPRSSRPHGQRESEPMAIYSGISNSNGRSMSTPIKAGVVSNTRIPRDSYQYPVSSNTKGKFVASITANASVAGFA